jgi:hypothetical protein
MPDPVTVGIVTGAALALGADVVKSTVGEVVKDAYAALKNKVAQWGASEVEALEKAPASAARKAVVAEVVDGLSADDKEVVRALAEQLIAALKRADIGTVGLDVGRLDALDVELGNIAVTEGTGARIGEARVLGKFQTGDITVGDQRGKKI